MISIAMVFAIVAIGCAVVGFITTKIVSAIVKIKEDFEKEDKK